MNRLEQIEKELGMAETAMAFGDLFVEDVRRYREQQLAGTGLTLIFPIWALPTDALARGPRDMVAAGLQARLTCVDPKQPPATERAEEQAPSIATPAVSKADVVR